MISFEAARAKVIEVLSARVCAAASAKLSIFASPPPRLSAASSPKISLPTATIRRSIARSATASLCAPPTLAEPGAKLRLIAESRAGVAFDGTVGRGECVRIFTGAPVPRGANAVVMHEYTHEEGDFVIFDQTARAGQYYVLAGAEARIGEIVVSRGTRLGYAELAMAAEVGRARIAVSRRPRVAILSTGDELVSVDGAPGPFQIRNSNNISLAAQVALAGGEPVAAGSAKDEIAELRARIEQGLQSDLLLLSGGVSVGKYDLVEKVLQDLGAEFFFDAVAIRPGKPVVFGWCRGKPVFGLPGNPVSTMVTFELFVVPAIEKLSGCPTSAACHLQGEARASRQRKRRASRIFFPRASAGQRTKPAQLRSWKCSSGKARVISARSCAEIVFSSCTRRSFNCKPANGWTFSRAAARFSRCYVAHPGSFA